MQEDSFLNPPNDPINWCQSWIEQAVRLSKLPNPNAMALATTNKSGNPEVRMVLLKGFDKFGPRFFTHYDSPKGQCIEFNDTVSLVFYWDEFERQLRMTGSAIKIDSEESDHYFHSRPRLSQIGAVASNQSKTLDNFGSFKKEVRTLESNLNSEIKRPNNWGGYRIKLNKIEFWQGHSGRLHQRIEYSRNEEIWRWRYLYP